MKNIFKNDEKRIIYVYSLPAYPNMVKIGETKVNKSKNGLLQRVDSQVRGLPQISEEDAVKQEAKFESPHRDKDIHDQLVKMGFEQLKNHNGNLTEWFKCSVEDVIIAEAALLGLPVTFWTGKYRDSVLSVQNFMSKVGIKNTDKSGVGKFRRDIEQVIKYCGDISIEKISEFEEKLYEIEKEHGDSKSFFNKLEALGKLKNEKSIDEAFAYMEKLDKFLLERKISFNDMLQFMKSIESVYWRVISSDGDIESAFMDKFAKVISDLQGLGCSDFAELEEVEKRIKKAKKEIKGITFNSIVPEENINVEKLKGFTIDYGKYRGFPMFAVALKDKQYVEWLNSTNYDIFCKSGLILKAVKDKKLTEADIEEETREDLGVVPNESRRQTWF